MRLKNMSINISIFLIIILLIVDSAFAQSNRPPEPKKSAPKADWQAYWDWQKSLRKQYLGSHDQRKEGTHDGNQIVTLFYNYGSIGKPNTEPSLVWPKASQHGYGFEFGVLVAGEVIDTYKIRRYIVSDGLATGGDYSPQGLPWGWEPLKGFADPDQEYVAMSHHLDNDGPDGVPNSDDDDGKPDTWPWRWASHPDWVKYDPDLKIDVPVWIGEYGKGVKTGDQESYYVMDDSANAEFQFWPDPIGNPDRRGLGIEVEARGYQWTQTLAQDCIFFIYNIKNVGADTLKKIYLGLYGDPHIGGANDYNDDDGAWDTKYDMVYGWDHDFRGEFTGWRPGYLGYKFLESPGEPYDGKDNDEDGLVDESMQNGIDDDGDWNPITDDVGVDGISGDENRNGVQDGLEVWDAGEGDGVPTHGEPNFDEKDLDEADQIGLTSFAVYEYGSLYPNQDAECWLKMVSGVFDTTFGQTRDNVFQYASGPIMMAPHDQRRFSITLLFGYDYDDLFRSAKIVQRIYDAGYRFTKAPEKPSLTAVPGDGRVTLYWDNFAEQSRDPVHGYDFEGYLIFRGTDVGFSDAFVITDAQGNPTLHKPIAQFDLKDGMQGPHPIESENGIHFYMGNDTGLRHSFVDTTVVNGQTYFYAVVSYDKGDSVEISPSFCDKTFREDPPNSGNYIPDINTAIVIPQAPALGYEPPKFNEGLLLNHVGPGTGSVSIEFIDPQRVKDNHTYEITFDDSKSALTFNMRDKSYFVSELKPVEIKYEYTAWDPITTPPTPIDSVLRAIIRLSNPYVIDDGNFAVFNADSSIKYDRNANQFRLDAELGWIFIEDTVAMNIRKPYCIKYQFYAIKNSPWVEGNDNNPYIDGMKIIIRNDSLNVDNTGGSRFLQGNSNFTSDVRKYPNQGIPIPVDYWIVFTDTVAAYSANGKKPCKFYVVNVTDSIEAPFVFNNTNNDSTITDQDAVIPLIKYQGRDRGTWQVKFWAPADSVVTRDSTYLTPGGFVTVTDTIAIIPIAKPPRPGDIFLIRSFKPFSKRDVFTYTAKSAVINIEQAKQELNSVAVVPNPYVAASEWERKPDLRSGRGERLLYFIHLPKQCIIRIYTLSGELVKRLDHDAAMEDGSEPWDLLSKDQMEVAYGIYIFHIDAPGVGQQIGKFAVIK